MRRVIPLFLLLGGCSSHLASFHGAAKDQHDLAFDEMRIELGDLRHAVQVQKTDLSLLQERLLEQENLAETANKNQTKTEPLAARIAALEKKLSLIEGQNERMLGDLKLLSKSHGQSHSNVHQLEERLVILQKQIDQCSSRLGDIQHLKTTLTQVSKAIGEKETPASSSAKRYRVKAGDTLEKIAKREQVSVNEIKRLNHLQADKIVIGQELVLRTDE